MTTYKISKEGEVLKIGFGEAAQNDQIVKEVEKKMKEMKENGELSGGGIIKINGPASLPVAMVLSHTLAHIYSIVAVFDPKLNKYVVCISHCEKNAVGDLID